MMEELKVQESETSEKVMRWKLDLFGLFSINDESVVDMILNLLDPSSSK
jgi:hypothetical protein